jgi:hypothetical protein
MNTESVKQNFSFAGARPRPHTVSHQNQTRGIQIYKKSKLFLHFPLKSPSPSFPFTPTTHSFCSFFFPLSSFSLASLPALRRAISSSSSSTRSSWEDTVSFYYLHRACKVYCRWLQTYPTGLDPVPKLRGLGPLRRGLGGGGSRHVDLKLFLRLCRRREEVSGGVLCGFGGGADSRVRFG